MPTESPALVTAVVDLLNSQTWTPPLTAAKRQFMRIRRDTEESGIFVASGPDEWIKLTRSSVWQRTRQILVVIKRPVSDTNASVDAMLSMSEQLKTFLTRQLPLGQPCVEVSQEEPFDADTLSESGQFETAIFFAFREVA